jgi:hypothetical protein
LLSSRMVVKIEQHNALSLLNFDISGHSIDQRIKYSQVAVWSIDCPLMSI